jgi:hypothetical protein
MTAIEEDEWTASAVQPEAVQQVRKLDVRSVLASSRDVHSRPWRPHLAHSISTVSCGVY